MTHADRIASYLRSIAPNGATNGEIARELQISPHQTVFARTRDLLLQGRAHNERRGREWVFYATDLPIPQQAAPESPLAQTVEGKSNLTPSEFEVLARNVVGAHYDARLLPGSVAGVRKKFDLVSTDQEVVGDAKYYTRVRGTGLPPAKFSVIAEHVWLLEKTRAPKSFLVFGNDREVPVMWLQRWGNLLSGIAFYFLTDSGELETLHDGKERRG